MSAQLRPIGGTQVSAVLERALADGVIDADIDTAASFISLDLLEDRIAELQQAFPAITLHTIAIKANPLARLLELVVARGCGLEAASLPELELALRCGAVPRMVVFDSPAKTVDELRQAFVRGVLVNLDNLQELERVDRLVADGVVTLPETGCGLRINPQVGAGEHELTSVATRHSKFGVPLVDTPELADILVRTEWLTGVHVHVGSQLGGIALMVKGIARVLELVQQVNQRRADRPLLTFDIGGGLPAPYRDDAGSVTLTEYAAALRQQCAELFAPPYRLITEFGRHMLLNAGWIATRVEYTKFTGDVRTAVVHVGADMLPRECYRPAEWRHEIVALDSRGRLKIGPTETWQVAGPLCFAGDYVGHDVPLPPLEPGDWLAILDTGAYTQSMWSRYNSRQMPQSVGYRSDDGGAGPRFVPLKARESVDDVVAFWR